MITEPIQPVGDVEIILSYKNDKKETLNFKNTVLLTGRRALAKSLSNQIGDKYDFYITKIIFGDGGTLSGVKKFVNAGREGLFGVTRLSKPALANIDTSVPAQAIFTSVIKFDEIVGVTINEMALQMANGQLYSMCTFPDLNKTEDMQITFNWRLNFI
jgi:hypothetical protein